MRIRNILCKTALSPSRLLGNDYALNPYRGCEHGCIYCYAPYVLREERAWGGFVDVKENIARVLSKELGRRKRGVVGIGTVTDPYQPLEKRHELTRQCLVELLKKDFPIYIQTKSDLVLRDIDLINGFSQSEVGITITTIDDEARKGYEPLASSVEDRLTALKTLAEAGIRTWAFLGPIMPGITDANDGLERIIKAIKKANASYLMVDKLNIKRGMRPNLVKSIHQMFPDLETRYRNISLPYFEDAKTEVLRLCRIHGLPVEFCY